MIGIGKLLLMVAWLQINPVQVPAPESVPLPTPTASPQSSPPVALDRMVGKALYYTDGTMENSGIVACRNRGVDGWQFAWNIACSADGFPLGVGMSSPYYRIGTWLTVCGVRSGVCRDMQVVDVSHPKDIQRHQSSGLVAELSYQQSARICGDGIHPANCSVEVILWSTP